MFLQVLNSYLQSQRSFTYKVTRANHFYNETTYNILGTWGLGLREGLGFRIEAWVS